MTNAPISSSVLSSTAAITENKKSARDFLFERRWRKRELIIATLWFVACLLYTAPASVFEALLRKCVPQLQLQNVAGSFWNGTATQAFWLQNESSQNNSVIALGSVEWHLQPWSLLWLHPSAHVTTNYGEQYIDAHVRVSPLGNFSLTNTSAALPATLLSNWAPIPARGQIAMKLDRADISRAQINALQGALYWQQAQWQWNTHWLTLGDYRCELSMPAVQNIHCGVQGQGALALDGGIDIDTKARSWSAQLQMKTDTALPDDFRQGIQLMLAAQPDAQGNYSIKRDGHW